MKKIQVIVDTVGSVGALHPAVKVKFPFVDKWGGHEVASVAGTIPHPHGIMCAEKSLMPMWDADCELECHFMRIFDSRGMFLQEAFEANWIWKRLEMLADACDQLYINNSWGGYVGASGPTSSDRAEAKKWRRFIKKTGATVVWAAGNDGDYYPDEDRDMPQTLLTDCSVKVASGKADGHPSRFSSDSKLGPPVGTFWGEDVALYNGVHDEYDFGSGTSFSSPKQMGLACKRGWNYAAIVANAKKLYLCPAIYQGPRPHPKWGEGWGEGEYQEEIRGCPHLHEASVSGSLDAVIKLAQVAPRIWFDRRLVG